MKIQVTGLEAIKGAWVKYDRAQRESGVCHVSSGRITSEYDILRDVYDLDFWHDSASWTGVGYGRPLGVKHGTNKVTRTARDDRALRWDRWKVGRPSVFWKGPDGLHWGGTTPPPKDKRI